MKTVSDKSEHKPSESHTLDEVLKSLQDLIRSELLDAEPKPPPPPKISHGKVGRPRKAPPAEPAAPKAPDAAAAPPDIESVMRSLKALVSNELADASETSAAVPDAPESHAIPTEPHTPSETTGATAVETARVETSDESLTPKLEMTPNKKAQPLPSMREKPVIPPSGLQQELLLETPQPAGTAAPEPDVLTLDLDELSDNPKQDDASDVGLYRPETIEPLFAESDEDVSPEPAATDSGPDAESLSTSMETEPAAIDIELADESVSGTSAADDLPGEDTNAPDLMTGRTSEASRDTGSARGPRLDPIGEELILESLPPSDAPETNAVPAPGDDTGDMIAPTAFEPEETPPAPVPSDDFVAPVELAAEPEEMLLPLEPLPEPDIELAEQPAGAEPGPAENDVPILGESVNFDDIPVLSDVVVPPPAAEPAGGIPYTPELPFPADRVRELAIRVVAKLNISLRRAGERPLDPHTIDRLQQIVSEELGKTGEK